LKISLHAGNCCGVKHIWGLSYYPDITLCARKGGGKTSFNDHWSDANNDMMHSNSNGKCDFFNEAAPKETYAERFSRLVEFIKDNRSHGIIEVVLNSSQHMWKPILEKHGFKEVTSGKNGNTGHMITIYHLVH
jgi:hypothetical protein